MDTSALTGEPVPRRVAPGDPVLAGMVNAGGLLAVRVTRPFAEAPSPGSWSWWSTPGAKAKTERFITTFSRYYTPAVVLAALSLALLPPLLVPGAEASEWIYRALVLLVISCPCALVLSIPVGYFGGIGGASRQGILVKGANFLDALAELDTVVVDKTGTLTEGPSRCAGEALDGLFRKRRAGVRGPRRKLFQPSHRRLDPGGLRQTVDAAPGWAEYEEIAGHGVSAAVDGGGRRGQRPAAPPGRDSPRDAAAEGTVVYVAVDGKLAGRIPSPTRSSPTPREPSGR